jgi:glycosyltransferase involved in cell wall biosynthesis
LRISVITPAYNAAPYVADAVRSVLAQTHPDLRLFLIDDGSTDDTAAIAADFADPRVTLIRQPNAGVAAARNRGMGAADGDALLFLDADDWLAPAALATLAATLEAIPWAVAAVGAYARVDAAGKPIEAPNHPRLTAPSDLLRRLVVQNQFANGGHVLIRHAAAHHAGIFRPGVIYGEDWDYFVRVALQGPFAFATTLEPLLFVRSRPEGAYRRFAADPAAFAPCMAAIFNNPDLAARLGATSLSRLRRLAEAENAWIVGRELVRQGRPGEGRRWLGRSVAAAPSLRRAALLVAAHVLPLLPQAWHGPFRSYAAPQADRREAAGDPA